MSNGEKEILKTYGKLYLAEYQKFLDAKLPGLRMTDTTMNVVRLLSSKNPDVFIKALVNMEIGTVSNRY